ncbi:GDP-mannose mannosyl hydrolase [Stutzerimonas urumqiensis]|uniref:GDP-mannose mannosyl hydrolase n=1 Tax=Stutzerimonas urumqiensis TaxID=638269 RepID=UPI000EB39DF8|nr:GDP-mannose mannosyl hydrolase [Stutzerimonas urumqiensis]
MYLPAETFATVVASTPLVSIDLVVRDASGAILLGERLNRPAQGFWFVPGGRIYKGETLDAAFRRLSEAELGRPFERAEARLLGVYEHFYGDSVFGEGGDCPDTHYVVLGYLVELPAGAVLEPPTAQHGQYRWWRCDDLRAEPRVHNHTRAYLAAIDQGVDR